MNLNDLPLPEYEVDFAMCQTGLPEKFFPAQLPYTAAEPLDANYVP